MQNLVNLRSVFHLQVSSVLLSDTLHVGLRWIDNPSKNKLRGIMGASKVWRRTCSEFLAHGKQWPNSLWHQGGPGFHPSSLQLSELQILPQTQSAHMPKQFVQKECPEAINGNHSTAQLYLTRKQSTWNMQHKPPLQIYRPRRLKSKVKHWAGKIKQLQDLTFN